MPELVLYGIKNSSELSSPSAVENLPAQLEPARQAHVGGKLDGHLVLPHVHQVVLRPPVWKGAT